MVALDRVRGLATSTIRGHGADRGDIADQRQTGELQLGGTDLHTIEELSDVVIKVTGADPGLVHHQESEILTTKLKRVDTSKSVRDLDHKNSYSLEAGMRLTADWMRGVYHL